MTEEITYHLKDFDGPLDLLLHLIRVNEMDILDIPIVDITSQYLLFLAEEKQRNLDVAGEFLVMAATLMRIKSRFLLPQPEIDESELAEIEYEPDPREALMNQLLEYQKYQNAADELREREEGRMLQFSRTPMTVPDDVQMAPLPEGLAILDLQLAFNDMLARRKRVQKRPRTMVRETWSIKAQMQLVMQRIQTEDQVAFQSLFGAQATRDEWVTTFLAVLELVRHQHIKIQQNDKFGKIDMMMSDKAYQEKDEAE
ncbi:segregation/condensation protein A [Weissella diestrammenae]|uniref:Segregation and condensation protein A n=1 Tax=Weissella diestrammenae TaxID=1162633 RepID=A0A7G9T5Q8_9LACO|nr:segregation/condensation protein A [Weissella diestrammenae]MCM0582259.1 segregation/condensation protein A [Weissella diestrammenae]QNN75433.1 segregation/condensation protein A [Weissella diestrammenae]